MRPQSRSGAPMAAIDTGRDVSYPERMCVAIPHRISHMQESCDLFVLKSMKPILPI
jgi:hypothetical protein